MKVTNKQVAEMFRKAKSLVYTNPKKFRNNQWQFICWAIDAADNPTEDRWHESTAVAERAKGIIMDRLRECYSLESWMVARQPGVDWNCVRSIDGQRKMQATRHAWLDSLIAEFGSK